MAGIVGRVMGWGRLGEADAKKYGDAESDGEKAGLEGFVEGDTGRGEDGGFRLHLLFSFAISPDSLGFKFCVAGILA